MRLRPGLLYLTAALVAVFCLRQVHAQSILQSGPAVGGHAPMYQLGPGQGLAAVMDSGFASGLSASGSQTGAGLGELLQINHAPATGSPFGAHVSFLDNPVGTPGGYHALSFDANALGGGLITYNAFGGAPKLPLQICADGNCAVFPFSSTSVQGTAPTTIGDVAVWANTAGTLINNQPPLRLNIPNGSEGIAQLPLGNPVATQSTLNVQATTNYVGTREYLVQLGLVSNQGVNQGNLGNGDKVTLYPAIEATIQSGNVWAINPLVWVNTGRPAVGHDQVSELDINNNAQNVDNTDGPNGLQYPASANSGGKYYAYGEEIECSGTFNCSAAIVVAGANAWLRGVGCDKFPVTYSCFYDYSSSNRVVEVWNNHGGVIDATNATLVDPGPVVESKNIDLFDHETDGFMGELALTFNGNVSDQRVLLGLNPTTPLLRLGSPVTPTTPAIELVHSGTVTVDFTIESTAINQATFYTNNTANIEMTIGGGIGIGAGNGPTGAGHVNATKYDAAGAPGVTCSGTPTSGFTSTGGIVTHC